MEWQLAYQSRGSDEDGPWLEPDLDAAFANVAAEQASAVIVAPIGFLCDQLEVLYDLDIEAHESADRIGLQLFRAKTVGEHPAFMRMLADRVRDAFGG